MRAPFALVLIAALTGCAAPPQVARVPFSEAEYAALPKAGTGTVTGQAFLTTRGGEVRVAAGREISLNPVTSYSRQWYQVQYQGGRQLSAFDPRIINHIITKVANAQGNFTFKNVPPGDYFITTEVTWSVVVSGLVTTTGGVIAKPITVRDGQETEVILTR